MVNSNNKIEEIVLGTFRKLGRVIGEDEYHMISQILDLSGHGLGFEYQLVNWHDIDKRFNSNFSAVPYSSRLHNTIEEFIKKGHISRSRENPIKLEYIKG